ncbi:hypothetical protein N8508_00490 [bacterium]|nr:hypothetical protein [bacterium]
MKGKKKLIDDSPTWFHEEMLTNKEANKNADIEAFKGYMRLGYSKEESMQMAGIKEPK